jgi:RimJ/RimL family protein N-acetyltransferase
MQNWKVAIYVRAAQREHTRSEPMTTTQKGTERNSFPHINETERLVLGRYDIGDADNLLHLIEQNRAQLVREFAPVARLRNIENVTSYIIHKRDQWASGTTFCFGIWTKNSPEQIGQIQVKNICWEIPMAELGYFIGACWQRKEYGSESVHAILKMAFQDLRFEKIFVRILPANNVSVRMAEKIGFRDEGVQRKAYRCGLGELHDVRYLGLTSDDYTTICQNRMQGDVYG